MPRLLSLMFCLLLAFPGMAADSTAAQASSSPAPLTKTEQIDNDVALFNPNIFSLDAQGNPVNPMTSPFIDPSSEVAKSVVKVTWFSAIIFLPFLVLPLVLLLYVVFKFRDHGDDRKPATFTGNHKLEVLWTAIPCLALTIVSVPTWWVLDWMEAPPVDKKNAMTIEVVGKQFAWDYAYLDFYKNPSADKKEHVTIGQNMGIQDVLVLPKGRTVQLHMTSDDVNHAWWIPAFGVKKDCIAGRYTYAWFTPDRLGVYKGQCAELCGAGHGIMLISASVVTPDDFARWVSLQQAKDDTLKVWTAVQPSPGTAIDEEALRAAVKGYLTKGDTAERRYALQFWIASHYSTLQRVPPPKGTTMAQVVGATDAGGIPAAIKARREKIDVLLKELATVVPGDESVVLAAGVQQ